MFSKALDVILPEKEADPYIADFKQLSKIRQLIRTYYEGVGQSLRVEGKKVQRLIDDHIRSLEDADTITVRTPYNKDKKEIQKIVLDKARWILRKQKEYRDIMPQVTKPSFKENTTLPYLGNNYDLVINKKQHTKNGIDLVDGKFIATIRTSRFTPSLLQKLYENLLRKTIMTRLNG